MNTFDASNLSIANIGALNLQHGGRIDQVTIAYDTLGVLSPTRDNVVLVCHALTGSPAVRSWWPDIIGDGHVVDPARHFVLSPNLLGSCYGSTGPESTNPETGAPYYRDFPVITTRDQARAILLLLNQLGIERVSLALGGSLGGMILLEIAAEQPARIERQVLISAGLSHTAWRIGFSSVIRKTIEGAIDAEGPTGAQRGLALARQIGMLCYRSRAEFNARFGRTRSEHPPAFAAETYLEHHGEAICKRFSPYAYITLTRAMELHDVTENRGAPEDIFSHVTAPTLVIGASSDILYDRDELVSLAGMFLNGQYAELNVPYGHDSFLVATTELDTLLRPFVSESSNQEVVLR